MNKKENDHDQNTDRDFGQFRQDWLQTIRMLLPCLEISNVKNELFKYTRV